MVGADAFRTDSVWPSGLLPDGRVTYFWDSKRIVGRCFGENLHPDRWPDSISIGQIPFRSFGMLSIAGSFER